MKGGYLCRVSLVVCEVEVVRQSFLLTWKPHGFEHGSAFIGEVVDQLDLSTPGLLIHVDQWQMCHVMQHFVDHGVVLGVQTKLGDALVKYLPIR